MMRISQDMLNKYAAGRCSDAERRLVEKWLHNDSWDNLGGSEQVKDEIGNAIWGNLSNEITYSKKFGWLKIAVAASIVLMLGFSFYYFRPTALDSHIFTNESPDHSKYFVENHYDVLLGTNSNASIDLINKTLTFSGDFIIKPKTDFRLLDGNHNAFVFKAGREYFVSDSPDFGRIVVFQKSDFAFLPSTMQIKIREQFQSI